MGLDDYGWRGKKVRNKDGREGVIRSEFAVLWYLTLTIKVSDGTEDKVELNADGKDGGSLGWEWWCENFSGGACWLPLGDHNPREDEQ